jgi:phosphoglycerate dehydrogenase-like enzyme
MRIAVLDDYEFAAHRFVDWSELGSDVETVVLNDHIDEEDELIDRIGDVSVLVIMRERTRITRTIVNELPSLELLVTTGMVNQAVDIAALRDRGIVVCGTGAAGPASTVELTWALILAALRGIPAADHAIRAGEWRGGVGRVLAGRQLGILGLGNIGSRVARIGCAFDMSVVAWSASLSEQTAREHGVARVDLDDLLRTSDVVSLHLVLSERTRGIIGRRELDLMKGDAWLVNTARGALVDEDALIRALGERRIGGAAIDVFSTEPLPANHRLRELSNTVLSPHLGYVTEEMMRVFFQEAFADVAAWRAGTPTRVIG